jgi:hypothetical protein
MSQIIRNSGFATQDIVTAAKLHNLVDTAQLGPEAITSQTVIPEGLSVSGDVVLGVDVSVGAIRKFALSDILENNLSCFFTDVTLGLQDATDFAWNSAEVAVKGEFRISFPTVTGARSTGSEIDQSYNEGATEGESPFADAFIVCKRTPVGDAQTTDEPAETINDLLQTVRLKKTGIIATDCGEFKVKTRLNGLIDFRIDTEPMFSARRYTEYATIGKDTYGYMTTEFPDRIENSFALEYGMGGGSPLWITHYDNTNVIFKGTMRSVTGLIYVGEEKEDPADEVIVDLNAPRIYDYTATVVSEALWSSAGGDTRVAAINVPTSGKIMLQENYVVPANETWTVEYEGHYTDGGDDAATTVWLLDDVVSKTYQFSNESNDGRYIGHQFVLDGGAEGVTFNIKVRGAVNSGSGTDLFTLFDDKYLSKRRITKATTNA